MRAAVTRHPPWRVVGVVLLIACASTCSALDKEQQLAKFRKHDSKPTWTRGLRGYAKPDFPWNPVVVVMAHSRKAYLRSTLCALLKNRDVAEFQVAVSVDNPSFVSSARSVVEHCEGEATQHGDTVRPLQVWVQHPHHSRTAFERQGLFKIAVHMRAVFNQAFVEKGYSHVVLLEEDLVPSPDFLTLFKETAWLLHADHSLWCVSAWNDNGMRGLATNTRRLFRTDFFPGLGWMMRAQLWLEELQEKWPERASTGWDHWMRVSAQHKDRDCIVPEVSRTRHIGDTGGTTVSRGTTAMLHDMEFASEEPAALPELTFGDLFYLMEQQYEALLQSVVDGAQRVLSMHQVDAAMRHAADGAVLLLPYDRKQWPQLRRRLKLFDSCPRGTHRGLITLLYHSRPLLLADRRLCPYLHDEERVFPDKAVRFVAAKLAQSCTSACAARGQQCRADQLMWAQRCEVLANLFPCEAGCGHQAGPELPAYVDDTAQPTHQQCLVSDGISDSCAASHRSTARVCACGPR